MPGGDRTGPAGMGPMTGRGAGYCAGYSAPGYANWGNGRAGWYGGFRGRGGWGRRNWFRATGLPGWYRAEAGFPAPGWGYAPPCPPAKGDAPTGDAELAMLKEQAEYFRDAMERIEDRISELEAGEADAET